MRSSILPGTAVASSEAAKEISVEEQMTQSILDRLEKGTKRDGELILRRVTGLAWLAAALGVLIELFYHEFFCVACNGDGSIGLIPLYLGFPIGAVGFVLVLRRTAGWIATLLAAAGLASILYFMFSYPNGAAGWIGAVFIGIAHLFLPLSGRFAAVLWTITGILGFPEFGEPKWGLISAFTVFGAATAISGAFVLWGLSPNDRGQKAELPEIA
jgi:hypothetical protein